MKKMISKNKLSKKAKKALNAEKRVQWAFPPVSRVIPNKKKNSPPKPRLEDDSSDGDFFREEAGRRMQKVFAVFPILAYLAACF